MPSHFDHLFKTDAVASEALSPDEAVLAIGYLMMVSDGEQTNAEMLNLDAYLETLELTEPDEQELREKIKRLYTQEGAAALFNAAKTSLPEEKQETALALAVSIALEDQEIMPEENDYLLALANAFGFTPERLSEVVVDILEERNEGLSDRIYAGMVDFFRADDWPFQDLEDEPVLQMAYQGENGRWNCVAKARESAQQLVFYSVCPIQVPVEKRQAIAEFITRANYGLIVGNFELDFADGEVRYKTSLDIEETELTFVLIKQIVYANVLTMDKYLPGILKVIYGEVNPAAAIAQVEDER
jgi:tellurite resistance protein